MNTNNTKSNRALRMAGIGLTLLVAELLTSCSMSLTRLPDGTFTLSGTIAQPVMVEGGGK